MIWIVERRRRTDYDWGDGWEWVPDPEEGYFYTLAAAERWCDKWEAQNRIDYEKYVEKQTAVLQEQEERRQVFARQLQAVMEADLPPIKTNIPEPKPIISYVQWRDGGGGANVYRPMELEPAVS